MSQLPRIIYNSINIDLERYWNEAGVNNRHRRTDQESEAGVEEFLNYVDRDIITVVKERITAHELQQLKQLYEFAKDGTAFEFLKDRDLGGFWGFEKTLNNNDLSALTFTRTAGTASNASYIDPSTGLLTFEDTLNIPRYPAGRWGHGLLIEGGRTNLVQNPGMDHGDWTAVNITVDNNTTEVLDPEGNNDADKLTSTAASAGIGDVDAGVAVGTDDGVFSLWVRCPSGEVEGQLNLTDVSGAPLLAVKEFTATPEWQRVQVAYENAGDPAANWSWGLVIDLDAQILYVYGPQAEVGADVLFASNYIKTAGATKARNADRAKLAPTNIINNLKGTIGFWYKPEMQAFDEHPALVLFEHGDSGGGDTHLTINLDTSGRLVGQMTDALGSTVTALSSITSVFTAGDWIYVVVAYDSTISNGINCYYDGSLLASSTNDAFVPKANQDFFNIGTNRAGNTPAFGMFDDFMIRKDVLSASQILRIYNMGRGLGEVRNRWANVILNNPEFIEQYLRGINRFPFELSMREKLT